MVHEIVHRRYMEQRTIEQYRRMHMRQVLHAMVARWKTYVITARLETTHGQYRTSYLVELSDMESVVSDVQQTMNNLKSSFVHRILRRLHNGALSNSLHIWHEWAEEARAREQQEEERVEQARWQREKEEKQQEQGRVEEELQDEKRNKRCLQYLHRM